MARPYDLYIRFLITRGLSDLDEINENLRGLNLPAIEDKELERHYNFVQDLLPASILNQIESKAYDGDFMRWMRVAEVHGLWEYEKPFRTPQTASLKLIYDLHLDTLLRVTINGLLIKSVAHKDVCQDVNIKFSALLKPEHVAAYERFFFDPRRMTRRDWRAFLGGCQEDERPILFLALTEPLDIIRTELGLNAKVNLSDTLQFLLTKAYSKAKFYLRSNSKEANIEARAWIDETIKLVDKYEKHRSGDMTDFSKALQMEFDYINTDFPTPDEAVVQEVALRNKVAAEREKENK